MAQKKSKMSKKSREKAISKAMRTHRGTKKTAPARRKRAGGRSAESSARAAASVRKRALVQIGEIEGTFQYGGRGFGFCVPDAGRGPDVNRGPDGGGEDVFIPPRKTAGAMTGDRVRVSVGLSPAGKRPEGEVVSVEPACRSVIGVLHVSAGGAYVTPDAKRFAMNFSVPSDERGLCGARDGYKVEIMPEDGEFFRRAAPFYAGDAECEARAKIRTVFGDGISKDANYAAVLFSHGIRTTFPEDALACADREAAQPVVISGSRVDLRYRLLLTIDGAGAKDLDDAISLERTSEGHWLLGVHIADVSHYVRPDSPTEQEARLRGTSVYFTDKVVPMLPESLSNGACSLNAGTDKYALTAEITLDAEGKRIGTRIYKSLVRSRVRGVYTEVNDLFENGEASPFAGRYRDVLPMLSEMKALYLILKKRSEDRGMLALEDAEPVILLDDGGNPVEIVRAERGDAEKLIEQFMLEANMAVAEVLSSLSLPCLYRVHEKPDKDKLAAFAHFVNSFGLKAYGLGSGEGGEKKDLTPRVILEKLGMILDDAEERGLAAPVSHAMLRSMMKAKYQSAAAPHFGLGTDLTCHFTSPIRRYPDLFVHSVITAVLERENLPCLTAETVLPLPDGKKGPAADFAAAAYDRGVQASDCEVRALEAERDIEDLYMTLYMASHIGESFSALVSSVVKSGLFVECENLVEGFVPASAFPGCRIDEESMTLAVGKAVYRPGTPIEVRLVEADVGTRRITFEVA